MNIVLFYSADECTLDNIASSLPATKNMQNCPACKELGKIMIVKRFNKCMQIFIDTALMTINYVISSSQNLSHY